MASFSTVPAATTDPIFILNSLCLADPSPSKVNLSIGAYRTESGAPYVLPAIAEARRRLVEEGEGKGKEWGHEYLGLNGLEALTSASARVLFGADHAVIRERRVGAVQTLSGTGANHLAALFLNQFYPLWQNLPPTHPSRAIHVPSPTWGNHIPIFRLAALEVQEYPYYSPSSPSSIDFAGMLAAVDRAERGSVFLLHACAHNPTGVDPTVRQWDVLAEAFKSRGHLALFDCAYLGFATGDVDTDAYPVRKFAREGVATVCCLSWSKSAGLYGERVGCLFFVGETEVEADACAGNAAMLQRCELSVPPAFGAKVMAKMLNDERLAQQWREDLAGMYKRILGVRQRLRESLESRYQTPGAWDHITSQRGMFTYLGLDPEQCRTLVSRHHIYLTQESRISLAGLNTSNVDYVAGAIDAVVRQSIRDRVPKRIEAEGMIEGDRKRRRSILQPVARAV